MGILVLHILKGTEIEKLYNKEKFHILTKEEYIDIVINQLELLDEKTKEAIEYRLKYPESSLLELSEIISYETGKPITKSGLNHRFRKVRELANKIELITASSCF